MTSRVLLATFSLIGATLAWPVRAVQIDAGDCRSATSTATQWPEWRPASNELHGEHEFLKSTRIVWPASVTSIVVELWGAGGGGGGGSEDVWDEAGAGGGGGASGAYLRQTVAVNGGTVYALVVGVGGAAGQAASSGSAGGDTSLCFGDRMLAIAPGGAGGQGATTHAQGGVGGQPVDVQASADPGIRRRGEAGGRGLLPLFEYAGSGGRGGRSRQGTVMPPGAFGGAGGRGESRPDPAYSGAPGADGSALVTW